ncbi:MAG: hypothetical protein CL609_14515 [Anaerolineaceae bacterium]|nr:hypothetical protein [Anaerolineaceae bacterium]
MNTKQNYINNNDTETIFFDDFTSSDLNRSNWNVEVTGQVVNNEQQAYVDSEETIYLSPGNKEANGILVIHPRFQSGFQSPQGKSFDFISGRINTRGKFQFTYGVVSARILLSAGSGLWPAFWSLGSKGPWPQCGEIDIMENVGETDWASVAVHGPGYFGETPIVNKKYFSADHSTATWHIYSVELTPSDGFVFRIDRELLYRVTPPMIDYYGRWVFSDSKYLILNCALGGTYPYKTNGVNFPYLGIPEETVRLVQNNEAKMLVDWVKVTKL